jgi:hypothetical protein
MIRHNSLAPLVALAAAWAFANPATAAIIYSIPGSTYSQNFDSLPNTPENTSLGATPIGWTDDTSTPGAGQFSIVGWYLFHPIAATEGGANGHQRMRIGVGTANTGAFMSFGSTGSTERALGMLNSNTMAAAGSNAFYGARITNNTGRQLASFTLSYTGEQWRDGGTPTTGSVAQTTTFAYDVGAASLDAATFSPEPLLDFTSPSFGATTENTTSNQATNMNWRNGNLPANRTVIGPVTVTGLNWQPGTDLWIRWVDLNNAGNDHGLAIDDLEFSAEVPEPASFALVAIALIGACAMRRSR